MVLIGYWNTLYHSGIHGEAVKYLRTKYWVLILLTCNQTVYDALYRQIVRKALENKEPVEKVMYERNQDIEILRKLCNGQLSSYERSQNKDALFP